MCEYLDVSKTLLILLNIMVVPWHSSIEDEDEKKSENYENNRYFLVNLVKRFSIKI